MKKTMEDHVVNTVVGVLMTCFCVVALVPFLHVVSKAFSSEWALIAGKVTVYPIGLQFSTMKYVIGSAMFKTSILNSVIVMIAGTVLTIVVTALTAYPLSKHYLPFRKPLMIVFVFTMLFNGGMIPTYLAMRQLKLTNTLWVLILQGAINVYNMLLIKNYYETIPDSIEESARIDGANSLTILVRIILPLCKPVLATVCLFVAVGLWNNYFWPMIFNTSSSVKTLPVYLRDIVMENSDDFTMKTSDDMMNVLPEGVRAATIVASTFPILVVYPFLQKYFIKGVLIGAVKG